jgi:hypothetical protein
MDFNRKMYFGIFDSAEGLTINDFKSWIIGLGFTVKCSILKEYGKEQVELLNQSDCENLSKKNQN